MPPDLTLGTKLNIAKSANFHFGIYELPKFSLFVQSFELPGLNFGVASQATPLVDIKQPGDKLVFDDLVLSFLIDEELQTYTEIQKWMMHLGYPRSTTQYKKLDEEATVYRRKMDLQCSFLTNKFNFSSRVVFIGAFPISLSALPFETNNETVEHLTATVTFAYDFFYFSPDDTL